MSVLKRRPEKLRQQLSQALVSANLDLTSSSAHSELCDLGQVPWRLRASIFSSVVFTRVLGGLGTETA